MSVPVATENPNPTFKLPVWFWVIGVIALLWNLMGLMAFVAETMMTKEVLQTLPEAQQELYQTRPIWVTVAFAVAVIAGTLGCLLLLLRMKISIPVLILSLLGVLGQQSFLFFMSDTFQVMGNGAMVLPILVLIIAIALVIYAFNLKSRRWLR